MKGVFIPELPLPSACDGRCCPFYDYGDQSGPDCCRIQVALGVSPFETKLHDLSNCPLRPCQVLPRPLKS